MVGMRDVAKSGRGVLSTVSVGGQQTPAKFGRYACQSQSRCASSKLSFPTRWPANLYLKRTNTIGVIGQTIAHPFFSTLTGICSACSPRADLKIPASPPPIQGKGESEYITCSSGT